MFIFIFCVVSLMVIVAELVFAPWVNESFSKIWAEEERPIIKRDTQERLQELFLDGDVPEETAVLMAAKEQNMEEEELLAMFNAVNARNLANIFKSKGPSRIGSVLRVIDGISKKGMRKKRG